ncbi:hypothetical protein Taro_022146 [Colocasia esculenta]|uniref:U1-type domain-containing protein n=1 Tax=Colocasia esculenta TaxID=4460 RepID=A0A843V0W9_COLES|nr:hypothetical protein [Colocasia esculenta]
MVWFQCEDCGENLKKPKLPNHFRICSAYKLSCIDCGETFSQQSVQGHTQCISEAEKYGPKDQAKNARDAQAKVTKPKPGLDIDINVGLSTRPPWTCSLCNTTTTSKQTLLLHADGKKHRAKAKAFHAAQKQDSKLEESAPNTNSANGISSADSSETKNTENKETSATISMEEEGLLKRRKTDTFKHIESGTEANDNNRTESANGEVIQSSEVEEKSKKRKKNADSMLQVEGHQNANGHAKEAPGQRIKLKKLIVSTLKLNSGVLKVKELQKLFVKALRDSGVTEDKEQLKKKMMDKISSSSRFVVDGKLIHLAKKTNPDLILSDIRI